MSKVDFVLFLVVTSCFWDAKAQYDIPPPEEYPEPPSPVTSMSISARAALTRRPFPTYPTPQTVVSTTALPKPTPDLKTDKVSLGEPGQGEPDSDHHHHHHHDHNPMPYSFKYDVNDPITGNVHSRNEVGDDTGLVSGSYQLIQPDGSLRVVEYTADWVNGFRANVRIIPNYAPPPPQPPTRNPSINVPSPATIATLITPEHAETAYQPISTSSTQSSVQTPTLVTETDLSPPTPGVSTSKPIEPTTKDPLSVPFKVGPHTVVCLTCN